MSNTSHSLPSLALNKRERLAGQALRGKLDIADLRSFLAVARHLNFTRAARELYIATSPLSRRIQDVEKALGVDLFERSSHSVSLTPFGRRLVPLAQDIVARFDDIPLHMTAGEPAVFDIGHTSTTPPDLVADVVNGVKQIFPTTDIRLVCARDAQLLSHIFDASIDLGLIVEPPPDPHVGSLRLRTWHAGVLMRWDDPLASSPELKLSDFIDNRFVLTGPGRWPSAMKTVEAQLVAAGIHDFDYTDDFLEIGWQVANRNAFGLGVVERAPITDVYQALGLISRLALGLEVTSHTALVWSTEWAKQDPGFGKVVAALHALDFGLSDHPGHGLGSRSVI